MVRASSGDIDIYQMPLALFGSTDTRAIVNVAIVDDNVSEDQEVFQLVLIISPSLQEIGIAKGTPSVADALIVDDDGNCVVFCILNIFKQYKCVCSQTLALSYEFSI